MRTIGLFLLFVGASCAVKQQTETPKQVDASFEIRYTNYSKGFKWRGIWVDKMGQVYQYDATELGLEGQKKAKSAASTFEVLQPYLNRVSQADMHVVAQCAEGLSVAATAKFSERRLVCFDYGQVLFLGYQGDQEAVTLLESGDHIHENLTKEAQDTVKWMKTLDAAYADIPCK